MDSDWSFPSLDSATNAFSKKHTGSRRFSEECRALLLTPAAGITHADLRHNDSVRFYTSFEKSSCSRCYFPYTKFGCKGFTIIFITSRRSHVNGKPRRFVTVGNSKGNISIDRLSKLKSNGKSTLRNRGSCGHLNSGLWKRDIRSRRNRISNILIMHRKEVRENDVVRKVSADPDQ